MGRIAGRNMLILTGLPVTIAVCVLFGWWLGSLADRHFGTGWVFQTAGVLLGVVAAVRDAAVQVRKAMDDESGGAGSGAGSGRGGVGEGGK
ncbi:AtpZ/AtpI family protein [Candidatus Fermentibacteria bacterium]|nr:AtpZ/AtpI family protein [Candidatus Fermentibacteria bacterium]